ncbi:MAG TPA: 2-C-methyl-D-erythritol 4-phosphate cytidylyltransferase [Marmoricola sp.]|nr:2-C-methyl-D-erythritol 4-phosphate cytidylyltransferase [Marmoricola sp.]
MSARAAIVLLAAGSGRRVGADRNKVLLPLDGRPVLAHSVRTALDVDGAYRVVVVVRAEDRDEVAEALAPYLGPHDVWLVDGGAERHDSEYRALRALRADIDAGEIDVVAIHDAARPLASAALFRTVIDVAAAHGAAVPAVPAGRLSNADGSVAAGDLVAVQTPQAFGARTLLTAYDAAEADRFVGTDTAACLERYADVAIHPVEGERRNLKITFAEDLRLAEELIELSAPSR